MPALSRHKHVLTTAEGPCSSAPASLLVWRLVVVLVACMAMQVACAVLLLLELWSTLRAVPLALWLLCQPHARKVEPLNGALCVVACNHLAV